MTRRGENAHIMHPNASHALPRWLDTGTQRIFSAVARLRGTRALHPRGATHRGQGLLTPHGAGLSTSDEFEAIVRFSRGAGFADRFPDVNGLAVRVVDASGPGRHRDLLFASAGPGVLRHILVPGVDFGRSRFSSIARYGWAGAPVVLTAAVRPDRLSLSELRRRAGAIVTVSAVCPDRTVALFDVTTSEVIDGERIRYQPTAPDDVLVPLGFLNLLRVPAYTASQAVTRPPQDHLR